MKVASKLTDNKNPKAKLELRRYFLRKYHASKPPDVFDACQATGKLWDTLRREFQVGQYWGCDRDPKRRNSVRVDSARVLAMPGWKFDVIDIDTYGSPWEHWLAALPNIKRPTTVFLTRGQFGMGRVPDVAREALGLRFNVELPGALCLKLYDEATAILVGRAAAHELDIVEAVEVDRGNQSGTRYFGIHLRPVCNDFQGHAF